jgi:chromosome segregation ATPase
MEVTMPEESKLAEKYENATKFSEEELEKVKNIQEEYFKIQTSFGQLSVAKIKLEEQLSNLDKTEHELRGKFQDLQIQEKTFLDEITKKYGEGNLNPETGEFIPNK